MVVLLSGKLAVKTGPADHKTGPQTAHTLTCQTSPLGTASLHYRTNRQRLEIQKEGH